MVLVSCVGHEIVGSTSKIGAKNAVLEEMGQRGSKKKGKYPKTNDVDKETSVTSFDWRGSARLKQDTHLLMPEHVPWSEHNDGRRRNEGAVFSAGGAPAAFAQKPSQKDRSPNVK